MNDGHAAIEAVLTGALDGMPAALREPSRRIAAAAGERLRAGLVLAVAGRAWPGTSRRTAAAAVAVELLHLASLVHDDLRDDAPVRRGVPTINAKEGTGVALLVGDVLIGLAHRLAANTGAGPLLADALVDLSTGRAVEADNGSHSVVTAAAAVRLAELRTGTLVAAAARLGAIVTGTPEDGLHEFGLAYGTAAQLLDDVLALPEDFTAGIVTLPVVHALAAHPDLRRLRHPGPEVLAAGVPATLRTVDDLVDRAAAARPELAELPRRHRDDQLALIPPRYRTVLSS